MLDTTMEMLDDADLEEEADAEVDAILTEITGGILGKAEKAPQVPLPSEQVQEPEEEERNWDVVRERLEGLRS
jgi:charged multivesicular body protein 3